MNRCTKYKVALFDFMLLYTIIRTRDTIRNTFLGLDKIIEVFIDRVLSQDINAVNSVLLPVAVCSILGLATIRIRVWKFNEPHVTCSRKG